MTSLPRHTAMRVRYPLRLRMIQVARIEPLSPRMRRIIFTGDDLEGFTTGAADDHVKLFFPLPGTDRPVLPAIADGKPVRDPAAPAIMRDYTPRAFNPQTRELAIEFVLHGDGPATSWAAQAQLGQWLGMGGPRGSFLVPDTYAASLLMGDETALPAIARRLEELPAGSKVLALIEVADMAEKRVLDTQADATIQWLPRNGTPAGQSDVLVNTLRQTTLPGSDIHAWVGAEIRTARTLRDCLMVEKGLAREQVRAAGYWREGTPDGGARVEE
ncbi:siderophore-interacting protein [Acetobacter sp. TBRC 12305]|uniref:Siderophore-interacting protein n=1 Tax=Acetobacter garciniae TaxID=2817435 RepID=A0A939HIU4_9PROT|nr:siderophore-interacting protein [Acetobacter garciniae]MBO1325220.1 siderophore-interacting protein [Acetobacter garciniae]MBX0344809.1 siderophore-interacting protein [Acetobacter garciniae]